MRRLLPSFGKTRPPQRHPAPGPSVLQQRDTARQQRDVARQQRDHARSQRDLIRRDLDEHMARTSRQMEDLQRHTAEIDKSLSKLMSSLGVGRPAGRAERGARRPEEQTGTLDYFQVLNEVEKRRQSALAKMALNQELSVAEQELCAGVTPCVFEKSMSPPVTPPTSVAFATVANDRFVPGLEALICSLLKVYPKLASPLYVFHDHTLSNFMKRRLRGLYSRIQFLSPDMSWFETVPDDSKNRKRIGKLGYMNTYATLIQDAERVILLDSDILVLDDISALWRGVPLPGHDIEPDFVDRSNFLVSRDCGDRPYAALSAATGDYIINSGVISIPDAYLNSATFAELQDLVRDAARPACPLLDRFADQKIWNLFLSGKPKKILPLNFNCNVKYIKKFLNGQTDFVRIAHFAGGKPWLTRDYSFGKFVERSEPLGVRFDQLWQETYRGVLARRRLDQYVAYRRTLRRSNPVKPVRALDGKPVCFMIGNGPSIANTDLSIVSQFETFAFNWFVLHDEFDEIRPDHLVLGSHQLFGGWCCHRPKLPEPYIEALMSRRHRPVIWTSFYFREYLKRSPLADDFEINYVLFEKPFKQFVDRLGATSLDVNGFLNDSRTGVLSVAVPVAVSLGFQTIGLVGCDADYNRSGGSNYFYDEARHQSLKTRNESLTQTWADGGRGEQAYQIVQSALEMHGCSLVDCTVGGRLQSVPKGVLQDFALRPVPLAA